MDILKLFVPNKSSENFYLCGSYPWQVVIILSAHFYLVKLHLPKKMANCPSLGYDPWAFVFKGILFAMTFCGFLFGIFFFGKRFFVCERFPRSDDNLEDNFSAILIYLFFIFKILEGWDYAFVLINKRQKKIEDRIIYRYILEVMNTYLIIKFGSSSISFFYCFSHVFVKSFYYAYTLLESADEELRPDKKWRVWLCNLAIIENIALSFHSVYFYFLPVCREEPRVQLLLSIQLIFSLIMVLDSFCERKLFVSKKYYKKNAAID